jgi:hypothetical protein
MSSNDNRNSDSLTNENNLGQSNFLQFKKQAMSDLDGAWNAALVYIGDKLGLYKAMYNFGKPITSQELADMTSTSERNV